MCFENVPFVKREISTSINHGPKIRQLFIQQERVITLLSLHNVQHYVRNIAESVGFRKCVCVSKNFGLSKRKFTRQLLTSLKLDSSSFNRNVSLPCYLIIHATLEIRGLGQNRIFWAVFFFFWAEVQFCKY